MMSINEGVNEGYWRLRRNHNTWVIKSWRRWFLRGTTVACHQMEGKHIVQERTLAVMGESLVHPGIQLDTFARHLHCEIFEAYVARCKGCAGNQR